MKKLYVVILIACMGMQASAAVHNHNAHKEFADCKPQNCNKPQPCVKSKCPAGKCAHRNGPNNCQAAPVLTSAKHCGSEVVVTGQLNSLQNTDFQIELFNNSEKRSVTEGQSRLGKVKVTTDSKGIACFVAMVSCYCAQNHECSRISATATRLRNGQLTDTSAFSKSVKVH